MPNPRFPLFARSLLIVVAAGLLGGCERIYPVRTLPGWVRGIYIPMMKNETSEPGLIELATRSTQEEFMADGRLLIVPKRDADLKLVATILDYRILVDRRDSDYIPRVEEIIMLTKVELYDPFDDEKPIAHLGVIRTSTLVASDPRSTNYMIEPEAKRSAMNLLARQIVNRTINGFPETLRGLPKGVSVPRGPQPGSGSPSNVFRNRTEIFD